MTSTDKRVRSALAGCLIVASAATQAEAQATGALQSDTTSCLARAAFVNSAPRAVQPDSSAPRRITADSSSRRRTTADSSTAPVAVRIFAAASAGSVTFATQPELRVRLCGGLDSIHVVERRNLPSPVVRGTTYRDVYVAVEIFGRLNADCITAALTRTARDSTARPDACASLQINTGQAAKPPVR